MGPSVSVLIDTYNHERFIEQAVVSVLEQDFPAAEREIIVVDDGSTDGTPAMLQKFAPHIRVLRKKNGGQGAAFNTGIPECRGQIVAFLDGDDWWARGKLRAVSQALSNDAEIGLVGHGITEVLADGTERQELLREAPRFRIASTAGGRIFRRRKSFLGTSRMTFRTDLLKQIGAVPEALRIQADEYLFTVGAVLSDALILREALTYYRLHGTNAFQVADGNREALRRKYQVLSALATALQVKLKELDVQDDVAALVCESVVTEADAIRLEVDGGYPWETVRTEMNNYRMTNETASLTRRIFKYATLLPALLLPPRMFYAGRQRVSRNSVYRKIRRRWMPFAEPEHVDRYRTTRS
jgi:glycosyltransferase involved in cell wall biosynthesis